MEKDGLPIRQDLAARLGRAVSLGAVYTALERLEAKGFVSSWTGGKFFPQVVLPLDGNRFCEQLERGPKSSFISLQVSLHRSRSFCYR